MDVGLLPRNECSVVWYQSTPSFVPLSIMASVAPAPLGTPERSQVGGLGHHSRNGFIQATDRGGVGGGRLLGGSCEGRGKCFFPLLLRSGTSRLFSPPACVAQGDGAAPASATTKVLCLCACQAGRTVHGRTLGSAFGLVCGGVRGTVRPGKDG